MIVLDTDAALALARGHEALHGLADDVAHTPGDWLHIPSLCLIRAEEKDEGVGRALLALPGIQVDPLEPECSTSTELVLPSKQARDTSRP